ncbi:RDD family protein [Streptomyces sp. CA-278952]|uniref:RDD family protein n=1 Tax=Streptomyces sp. CA-278952 TaxID=2980556 RepID=UPI002368A0FA|nr:RDD family protein [Streptomyces sp. CA-278952]WDG30991.1 RDD family protein [Streptomyces sp. CA-278952]
MSAPTPAPGDESPREGYYPDPSIPGYVRYWNGASWVPGTSRPAPRQAGPSAAPAAGEQAAPVEETGPIFFDEEDDGPQEGVQNGLRAGPVAPAGSGEPIADHGGSASVWQADTARQNGFGGERDRRVDWGGPAQEPAGHPSASADPRAPLAQDPVGGALPGTREGGRSAEEAGARPPTDGTVTIRPVGPRAAGPSAAQSNAVQPAAPAPSNAGTQQGPQNVGAARNSLAPAPAPRALPAQAQHAQPPQQPQHSQHSQRPLGQNAQPQQAAVQQASVQQAPLPTPAPAAPAPAPAPAPVPQEVRQGPVQAPAPVPTPSPAPVQPAAPQTPLRPGLGGGSASWAQQVHQLAQPEPQQRQPNQQQQPHQLQHEHQGPGADQPVVPWKPPVDDPFQQLARNQASARPAGLGKRLAARLVDSLVLGAAVGAAAVPLATRALDHIDRKITAAKETGETVTVWLLDSTTGALLGTLLAAFLLIGFLLEALPTAKWGRTLGKKLCGLDVRDIESHDAPTLGAALRRWLVYGVLGLLVIGVANVLWCLIDRPWRQCWHDKAARTFVAG